MATGIWPQVSDSKEVEADAIIIATGASAKRLRFPGSDEETGFWNRGISACAICDGTSPLIRNKPVAVIGGGDSACEEACYLTQYASKVYLVHRFDYLEASKAMQKRLLSNPKIEVLWQNEVVEAFGNEDGNLGGIKLKSSRDNRVSDLHINGLFFAIGHTPATEFLQGQLELDHLGLIKTEPGTTCTSVPGVFAAGDVQDHKYKQAIVAAGLFFDPRLALPVQFFGSSVSPSSYRYLLRFLPQFLVFSRSFVSFYLLTGFASIHLHPALPPPLGRFFFVSPAPSNHAPRRWIKTEACRIPSHAGISPRHSFQPQLPITAGPAHLPLSCLRGTWRKQRVAYPHRQSLPIWTFSLTTTTMRHRQLPLRPHCRVRAHPQRDSMEP